MDIDWRGRRDYKREQHYLLQDIAGNSFFCHRRTCGYKHKFHLRRTSGKEVDLVKQAKCKNEYHMNNEGYLDNAE